MNNFAWITWERQQRNISMARIFGADYYEFSNPRFGYFSRLLVNSFATFRVFRKHYQVIFVQNPSIALVAVSIFINLFFKKKIVIDAHNAGVIPREGRIRCLVKLNNFLLRRSHLVIVSNPSLQARLSALEIPAMAMPDPIPNLDEFVEAEDNVSSSDVFIICSWSDDEPIELYFSLASALPNVTFAISGKVKEKYGYLLKEKADNLDVKGFLPEDQYFQELQKSKIVIDLTTRNDCLVCGAYEAISSGIPIILSDTLVNREVFRRGVVFAKCDLASLKDALLFSLNERSRLVSEIGLMKDEMLLAERLNRKRVLEFISK